MRRLAWLMACLVLAACQGEPTVVPPEKPAVPRGYVNRLEIQVDDRVLSFGPFVGYYFKPQVNGDLQRLAFVCFNEGRFYTRDLPANSLLFEGQAVWQRLPEVAFAIPRDGGRIVPVFFDAAPAAWRNVRPDPQNEYRHFHSAYDGRGATLYGYWLRHVAQAPFTYDMGGRVGAQSPLYHAVEPGIDRNFACIIEFDHGPGGQPAAHRNTR